MSARWESSWVDVGIGAFAVAAMGLTLWFSLGPAPTGHGSDKALHALAYFVDTLALLLAAVWRPGRTRGRVDVRTLEVAVGLVVLGGLLELVQGGFVHRDAQLGDWIADAAGVTVAVAVFVALRRGAPGR